MDAKTVFTSVSLTMLANGVVLAVISRDLPAMLRPAAHYWQIGTLLIAIGCTVFAFGAVLPRPVMLIAANCLFVFGLTAYHWSLQKFHGLRPTAFQFLPAAIVTVTIFWFSVIHPNFMIKLGVVTAMWTWLMLASMLTLTAKAHRDSSLSRKVLTGIHGLAIVVTIARFFIYLRLDVPNDFAVETGASWMNLATPMMMTLLPVIGTTAFVLMCSDQLKRQLARAASTDYLTGLPNRRTLAENGRQRFRQAQETSAGFAVAILDLDAFKAINDTHGHDVGDQVLVHVADRLRAGQDRIDFVARSGGEEFVLLFDETDDGQAFAMVEHIRRLVETGDFEAGGALLPITLSAGVAVHRSDDRSFDDMLRRADAALYRAKSGGRNRVERAA